MQYVDPFSGLSATLGNIQERRRQENEKAKLEVDRAADRAWQKEVRGRTKASWDKEDKKAEIANKNALTILDGTTPDGRQYGESQVGNTQRFTPTEMDSKFWVNPDGSLTKQGQARIDGIDGQVKDYRSLANMNTVNSLNTIQDMKYKKVNRAYELEKRKREDDNTTYMQKVTGSKAVGRELEVLFRAHQEKQEKLKGNSAYIKAANEAKNGTFIPSSYSMLSPSVIDSLSKTNKTTLDNAQINQLSGGVLDLGNKYDIARGTLNETGADGAAITKVKQLTSGMPKATDHQISDWLGKMGNEKLLNLTGFSRNQAKTLIKTVGEDGFIKRIEQLQANKLKDKDGKIPTNDRFITIQDQYNIDHSKGAVTQGIQQWTSGMYNEDGSDRPVNEKQLLAEKVKQVNASPLEDSKKLKLIIQYKKDYETRKEAKAKAINKGVTDDLQEKKMVLGNAYTEVRTNKLEAQVKKLKNRKKNTDWSPKGAATTASSMAGTSSAKGLYSAPDSAQTYSWLQELKTEGYLDNLSNKEILSMYKSAVTSARSNSTGYTSDNNIKDAFMRTVRQAKRNNKPIGDSN